MVKHAVQYDLHAAPVDFLDKFSKKSIAGFQVLLPALRITYFFASWLSVASSSTSLPPSFHNPSKMGVNMFIILAVVLMVGWGYENRVKVNDLHAKAFDVVQLIPDPL